MIAPTTARPPLRAWLRRHVEVLVALTISDLQARYGRGPLRLLKWLLDPFAVAGVYLLLVSFVLDRPGAAPGLSIACAIVPFNLIIAAVSSAIGCVSLRRSIILNMVFDRTLIPLAAVLTEAVAFVASLALIVLMMAVYGVAPTLSTLWLPVVILQTLLLATACAYPVALLGVWFRDLRPFFVSFVRTMFFLAPGLVALVDIRGRAHDLVKINPLTGIFESYRDVLVYGNRPATWQLLSTVGFAVALLAIFVPLYRAEQKHFAKVVE